MKAALFIVSLIVGGALHLAGPPKRIISISPIVREIRYGIGAFDRVVGLDYWRAATVPKRRVLVVVGRTPGTLRAKGVK